MRTYWDDLRQGKRFPAARDLDGEQIARASRNAVLMRLRPDGRRLEVRNRFASALVSSSTDGIEESEDVAAPMIEWCLLVAGRAAREGRAMTAFEDFASRQGNVRYRAVALPLADDREHVDHVLCEICRER